MLSHLKEELIEAIPAIIFFAIALNLINFSEALMFRSENIKPYSYLTVTIAALFIGKFLIIVNNFPFINVFPNKPLIYNIVWKMLLYSPLIFLFRIAERFVEISWKSASMQAGLEHIATQLTSPVFWAIQLWVMMLFVIYVVSGEFVRILGRSKIKKLILG